MRGKQKNNILIICLDEDYHDVELYYKHFKNIYDVDIVKYSAESNPTLFLKMINQAAIVIFFISKKLLINAINIDNIIKFCQKKYENNKTVYDCLIPIYLDNTSHTGIFPEHSRVTLKDEVRFVEHLISQQLNRSKNIYYGDNILNCDISILEDSNEAYTFFADQFCISSKKFPQIAFITDTINADIFSYLSEARKTQYTFASQDHESIFSFTINKRYIDSRILSFTYDVYTFYSGAAHGNHSSRCYNFLLSPFIKVDTLRNLFADDTAALNILQSEARNKLGQDLERSITDEWIIDGTSNWDSFKQFQITKDAIAIHFSDYAVCCYADGPQSIEIEKFKFTQELNDLGRSILSL